MSEMTVQSETMVMPIAYPLDDFYARAGRPLPSIAAVNGAEVPEPYRTLLVHDKRSSSSILDSYSCVWNK